MRNQVNPNIIFVCIASILVFLIVVATSSSKEEGAEKGTGETPVSVVTPDTTQTTTPAPITSATSTTPAATVKKGPTLSDVATHKDSNNCWLVISSKVYNVTSFIGSHPGGKSQITSRCGKDVTTAFNGGVYKHSSYAKGLLPTYFVGNLSL